MFDCIFNQIEQDCLVDRPVDAEISVKNLESLVFVDTYLQVSFDEICLEQNCELLDNFFEAFKMKGAFGNDFFVALDLGERCVLEPIGHFLDVVNQLVRLLHKTHFSRRLPYFIARFQLLWPSFDLSQILQLVFIWIVLFG